MNHTDVIDYIKSWATELIAIAHTEEEKRFFYNIDEFREEATNHVLGAAPCLVMEDRHRGRLSAASMENFRDKPSYSFFIMRRVEQSRYEEEELAFQETKALAFKLVAKMRKEAHGQEETIAKWLAEGSISYRREGPQLDNFHGVMLSFEISDNLNDQLIFDENDYL